jgi:glycosyltransferase involved in cell wall biosynthesis
MNKVAIYFFTGDFVEAIRRFDQGHEQIYETHNEVARLFYDLRALDYSVHIYSFFTAERNVWQLADGSKIVSLGAKNIQEKGILRSAVLQDDVDSIIAHFPNSELLKASLATGRKVFPILAGSYNRTSIRSRFRTWRLVSLLNDSRFELISNHCLPATEQLAKLGVKREKLIAWDIKHPFDPGLNKPKTLHIRQPFEVIYVGTIMDDKGIPELVRAIALLREGGMEVRCTLAGDGNIPAMRTIAGNLKILDLLSFVGLIGNTQVFNMMVNADLVVIPSRIVYPEGFPLTMFEAIASRTPIVCSNHPMFREVMVDGQSASVFVASDHHSLAEAIRRTLTDPLLYANLSANASRTWDALKGPADWRTMLLKWVVEGPSSPWIRKLMLSSVRRYA